MSVSNKTKAIVFTAILLALLLAALIGLTFVLRLSSTGTIKTVGCAAYFDAALTQRATSINWGTVTPGSEKNQTLYILNTSNVPVNLTLGTENWAPNATSHYIALFWNYNKTALGVNKAFPVTLMFDTFSNATSSGITNFTFDIIIVANG